MMILSKDGLTNYPDWRTLNIEVETAMNRNTTDSDVWLTKVSPDGKTERLHLFNWHISFPPDDKDLDELTAYEKKVEGLRDELASALLENRPADLRNPLKRKQSTLEPVTQSDK